MTVSKIYSAQTTLLKAQIIDIEVDLSKGLHAFSIVGLGDKSVAESKDRVGAAIKNSGWKSPKNKNQKVVVSLAPADIKKEGPIFDLPIALAYLIATGDIRAETEKRVFVGELSLDGELRPIKGALPITQKAKSAGFSEIFLPLQNAPEASHIVDIKGQESAKRGLEIAAAGNHNIAMYGPPGTGKTMLARAFKHLLPELSFDEMLEVTSIYSISGLLSEGLIEEAPFRSPHHTASYVSLVVGGANLKPGEITLAHKGVLFMDEFPEFDKKVLESLRQPLEDRE